MAAPPPDRSVPAIHLGVFCVTGALMALEIALTRVFSAVLWYHYTFIAISVALMGLGLGAFAAHLWQRRRLPAGAAVVLALAVAAASVPCCLWLIVRAQDSVWRIFVSFLAAVPPFFLGGMAVALVFHLHRERASTLYFADLAGAGCGAVLACVGLAALGGQRFAVAVAAALAAAAWILWAARIAGRRRRTAVPLAALTVCAAIAVSWGFGGDTLAVRGSLTKAMFRHLAGDDDLRLTSTRWNAFSRVDMVRGFEDRTAARLYTDCDAWTNVLRWDGTSEGLAGLAEWFRALPFDIVDGERVLVIGPGGGADVAVALAAGADTVHAVDMNPLMFGHVNSLGAEAGDIYRHPSVQARVAEGRSYLAGSRESFDVILLGFVDTWASVASGGLALSESHLYTTEAFEAYLDHLEPGGVVAVIRWGEDVPRLVANAVEVLGDRGISTVDAGRHIAAFRERQAAPDTPPQVLFLLCETAFSTTQLDAMAGWAQAEPIWLADAPTEGLLSEFLRGEIGATEYLRQIPTRGDPVTDDQPFYFACCKPWRLPTLVWRSLLAVMGVPLALAAVIVAFSRGGPSTPTDRRRRWASIGYFSLLGIGYIAVEVACVQKLMLLLGNPVMTLSVIVVTFLFSSAVGSAVSARLRGREPMMCVVVAAVLIAWSFILSAAVVRAMSLATPLRVAVAAGLVVPPAFLMGMPFPTGLRRAGEPPFASVPFYWSLNGLLSVVGSAGATVAAVFTGFDAVLGLGAIVYLAAAAAAVGMGGSNRPVARTG